MGLFKVLIELIVNIHSSPSSLSGDDPPKTELSFHFELIHSSSTEFDSKQDLTMYELIILKTKYNPFPVSSKDYL